MDKKQVLLLIRQAKSSHIQWRSNAQAHIAGYPQGKNQVPVTHKKCKFGEWYYGTGQSFAQLDSFKAIHRPHKVLHRIYMDIFTLLFRADDEFTLKKIFKSKAKLEEAKKRQADALMKKMLHTSERLLETIQMLVEDVEKMSEKELSELE